MTFDLGLVNSQKADFGQIKKILGKAKQTIASANILVEDDHEAAFTLAYESMLKTSLALMLSRGYRPKTQLGHHKTLVMFAKDILNDFSGLISTYDRMRQKRHKLIYDVSAVGLSEAKNACIIAQKYYSIVLERIESENPQKKLEL